MKISNFIFLLGILVIGFASCKKDEAKSMTGTWEGTWGYGYEFPSFFEKWDLEKNGDLLSFFPDGSLYANGTWELDGEEFEALYTTLEDNYTYRFTGEYDEDKEEIKGTWVEVQFPTNGGTFEMEKE